jgi:hypothetical protein
VPRARPPCSWFCRPEITALSVGERALMRTTVWGNGSVSSLAIVQPTVAAPIRIWAEHIAEDRYYRQPLRLQPEFCSMSPATHREKPPSTDLDHI